jgi:hypothetical protein
MTILGEPPSAPPLRQIRGATAAELREAFGLPPADDASRSATAPMAAVADRTEGSRVAGPAEATWSAPLRALVAAVSALGAQQPAEMPKAQAVVEARELLIQLEALHAVVLERVADVDVRQLHVLDGAPSTGTWVAAQPTSVDRGEVALARRLGAFPQVAQALRDSRLSVQGARQVAAALTRLRRHVDRPDGLIDGQDGGQVVTAVVIDGVLSLVCEAMGGLSPDNPRLSGLLARLSGIAERPVAELSRLEAGFVVLAEQLEPGLLSSGLTRLVDAVVPSALEAEADDAHERRAFTLRRDDDGAGWTITEGRLDAECGELLHTVLNAELAVDPDNPVDTAEFAAARADGWQPLDGHPTDGPAVAESCGRPRSWRQRRHDALRNGLRRYLDSGIAGLRDKVAPHLSVTVSLAALHDAPGALGPVAGSGALLPRSLVRAWWCDSAVSRFVLGLGGKVIETSHTERTLKPHERRAKRIETGGGCQGAGCTRGPGSRLVPHHPTPWAVCGTTSLTETVLLCDQSHHDLHSGGHVLRLRDGRLLGPDGWVADGGAR